MPFISRLSRIADILHGTPWYVDTKEKDPLGLSIVIRSKKSLDYLSIASVRGELSACHRYEDEPWPESGFPKFFNFDDVKDILPWLKTNMDTRSMLAY